MTKIKLNWAYAKGELDTDTLKLICLPARGKRLFGADELDAELCIKDGMNNLQLQGLQDNPLETDKQTERS